MQKSFTLDRATITNIAKGALHSVIMAAVLGLLDYLLQVAGTIQSGNILVTIGLAWFSSTGYNAIKEFIKGY